MKNILLLLLLFICRICSSQVPPQKEDMSGSDFRGMEPEMPSMLDKETERAGTYQIKAESGFVYPKNQKQKAIYDKIYYARNGFIVKKDGLFGIADTKGVLIGEVEYDSIVELNSNTYLAKKSGKYGTLSSDGKLLLPLKYEEILFSDSKNSVSFVKTRNGDIQMIFNSTRKLYPHKIEYAELYANLVILKIEGKFGVIKNEQTIIPFKYDSIFDANSRVNQRNGRTKNISKSFLFNNSKSIHYLTIQLNNKYGFANSDGTIIYHADNDDVTSVEIKSYYTIKKDKLLGIYFLESRKKTEIEFENVYADGLGYVMAVKNNKAGVFNLKGEQIVPFKYDNDFIAQLSGIGLRISKDKKRGIIDAKGNVLVDPIYDDVNTLYESGFRDYIKVTSGKNVGIVNLKGEIIVPLEYEWIGVENSLFKVATHEPTRKFGLVDKTGKVIVPAKYNWITNSDTEKSKLTILKESDHSYNFLNSQNQLIFSDHISEYGYVLNQRNLLNPFSSAGHNLLFIKDKNGQVGMLNALTGIVYIPMEYDAILQTFESGKHAYCSVKKGKKLGLINELNQVIIPFEYDAIDLDFIEVDFRSTVDETYQVVVSKGKKFGTVDLKNQIKIPFRYTELKRISEDGLYKAKTGNKYQIINSKNEILNKDFFDEVANFEQLGGFEYGDISTYHALTFTNGKMRVINNLGEFISSEIEMQSHNGFKTFDELKSALIMALDDKDDILLKQFTEKIAPSEHILFYLKQNKFDNSSLEYTNIELVKEKYYKDLIQFKYTSWNENSGYGYKRSSLTTVTDYTMYREGYVTNVRNTDHAFGDTRFMEKLLRNSIKINGFWISSYFMKRGFY